MTTTTQRTNLTLPFWGLNALMARTSYHVDISYEKLSRRASQRTGLADFGDPLIQDGFRRLLTASATEGDLSFLGRLGVQADTLLALNTRLRIVDLLKRQPEVNTIPLRQPIFIVGLPRTGTTLLHHLFWQDPQFRIPLAWELWSPFPTWEQPSLKQRHWIAQRRIWSLALAVPHFRLIHDIEVHKPEECILAFPYHLANIMRTTIPSYKTWCLGHNFLPEYRYYRQILQALQWQQIERSWVLKSPYHLWKMEALFATFPDALIIQTHRDPSKSLSSWCSLVAALQLVFERRRNLQQLGREWLALFRIGMESALAERAKQRSERFFDLHYQEFMAQPLAVVQRIYDHFGLTLTPETQQRMRAYLAQNQQHKLGKHTYSLEEFGIDAAMVAHELREYTERFAIPIETRL